MEPIPDALTLTKAQLEALSSPLRSQILGTLRLNGPQSAAEVSEALGVPVKRLYYHLHEMVEAGLLRVVESRRKRSREEAVYGTVAKRYLLDADASDPAYEEAVQGSLAAMLRLAIREHGAALAGSRGDPGLLPFLRVDRAHAWLSEEDARELYRRLDEARRFAMERSVPGNGRRVALTTLVMPVLERTPRKKTP